MPISEPGVRLLASGELVLDNETLGYSRFGLLTPRSSTALPAFYVAKHHCKAALRSAAEVAA